MALRPSKQHSFQRVRKIGGWSVAVQLAENGGFERHGRRGKWGFAIKFLKNKA